MYHNMQRAFQNISEMVLKYFDKAVIALLVLIPTVILGLYLAPIGKKAPIRTDAIGYYAYLPAVFNEHDLSFNFLIEEGAKSVKGENSFNRVLNPEEAQRMGFNKVRSDRYFNKYPIGVSVLLIPFFVLGHILTTLFREDPDGWSFFYQYMVSYGGIAYFLSGILLLKRILLKYFSPPVVVLSLILTIFGTNLFNYATYENVFSHIYSFFFITLLLYITPIWLKKFDMRSTIIIALTSGFILLIRQINIIFLLIPFLYSINTRGGLKERFKTFWKHRRNVLTVVLVIFIILIPQFVYFKYASSSWITFSYVGEGFTFSKPLILKVLFSTQKGLYFWSPLLVFATLGLFLLKDAARNYLLPAFCILILQVFLISSWSNWQFGWSYGHRAFVDSMSLFALGFGGFYTFIKTKKSISILIYIVTGVLLFLSMFQMVQYWMKIIPPIHTTFEEYRNIFLSLDTNKQFYKQGKLY